MAHLQAESGAALAAQRRRLAQLRGLLAAGETQASVDRAALERATVDPRPRPQVERELSTWENSDLPMLRGEIAAAERAIAKVEASQQPPPPFGLAILVPRGDSESPLERARDQLRELHDQRSGAVTRVMDMRRAIDIAVSKLERDGASERRRLGEAIDALAAIDRQIDQVGADVKRLDGIGET